MNNILPSSESNFFDYNQKGPINLNYPVPNNISGSYYIISGNLYKYSGVYYALPSANLPQRDNSIFDYTGLSGKFSNYSEFSGVINNFNSFNQYIHYYPKIVDELDDIDSENMNKDRSLKIPYLSSYKVNTFVYNPYRELF